ncbi:MAG TPA: PTS sugar transporter subunit IIA [Luteolibacter sp.]
MPSSLVLPSDAPLSLDLDASEESDAIVATAELLRGHPDILDHAAFVEAILERQKINPPLLGSGIALPHARTSKVKEIVFAVARCARPVPFGDQAIPVRLIFLYGIPPHRVAEHLATVAALARKLRNQAVIDGLLAAPDAATFFGLLRDSS